MAKRRRLGDGSLPSCTRPTYGGVLAGDLMGGLAQLAFVAGGAGVGFVASKAFAPSRATVGAIVGAGVGAIGGIYPSLLAQRAGTRTPDCAAPSLAALFGYTVVKTAIAGAVGVATRQLWPTNKTLPGVVSLGVLLAVPLAGRALIRT